MQNVYICTMTTTEIISLIRAELKGLYEPKELESITRALMEDVLHYSPVDTVLRGDFEQDDIFADKIRAMTLRLKQSEPLQYVLGHAPFHGHDFKVTPATLIPRPETERMVDMIADENEGSDLHVLDMGTGSGCIAISLARALKFAQVTGIDVSAEALQVALENARNLKAEVRWEQKDMLTLQPQEEVYDIIVSNPPYVCESERRIMEPNVLRHEPAAALFVPDGDPLKFYKAIAGFAIVSLKRGGKLYLEINQRFGTEMRQLLEEKRFTEVRILNDQYGQVRYAIATRPA